MQGLLGDLILKGEKFGSKQDENEYLPKRNNFDSNGGEKEGVVEIRGRNKGGMMDLGGRPSQFWMVVIIHASVSSSIYQFLQILYLL